MRSACLLLPALLLSLCPAAFGEVKITPDMVYGHKHGLAMTFDVFAPTENANGAGVLFMVSGGWYSQWISPEVAQIGFKPLTDKGFTVFAVRHGSSPKFGIAEAVADVRRAARYIRLNAETLGVDPKRLGVYGFSAGGHLSLMLGTASDEGNPQSNDPVEKVSNRVAAVVAFVAPTDITVMSAEAPGRLEAYKRFPALELDLKTAKEVSPLVHVTPDDPPTLLLVGAKDELVPIFHSQNIHKAFQEKKVTSELIVYENAGHGFGGQDAANAVTAMVNWFEKHLAKQTPAAE